MTKDEIINVIYSSIDDINQQNEINIPKTLDAVLFGRKSDLDSLGLINLINTIEEKIEEATGEYISITDERAMSLEVSPFKTVGTLANYIETLLNE